VAGAVIMALARFHALGNNAHNDIEPENILITHTHGAVLADFGIAGPCDVLPRGGTARYMAPELLAAARLGPASTCAAATCTASGPCCTWRCFATLRST
jgi:serine/threonine protein kinase